MKTKKEKERQIVKKVALLLAFVTVLILLDLPSNGENALVYQTIIISCLFALCLFILFQCFKLGKQKLWKELILPFLIFAFLFLFSLVQANNLYQDFKEGKVEAKMISCSIASRTRKNQVYPKVTITFEDNTQIDFKMNHTNYKTIKYYCERLYNEDQFPKVIYYKNTKSFVALRD